MAIGKKRSNIRNLVTAILILIGFIAVCPLSNRVYNVVKTEDISNYNTEENIVLKNFQVLIFTSSDKVEALPLYFIKDIKQQKELAEAYPNYSFLVPEGKESLYNEKLKQQFKSDHLKDDFTPDFEVEKLSAERQKIKFGVYGDGEGVFWYEATDKEIFPKKRRSLGAFDAFGILFYHLIITGSIAALLYGLWRLYNARFRKHVG